ncbi:uncharacterized protein B0P05DRAFT_533951 [Gilbertella persicaria]|uniref:uncharacterized protein n=1 Tax=Gilbertella persicaria TaxID=101096 RepID=UPI00221E4A91|nr:uncharacterized protein B0P05DRAFT_533951 [Gilbertella persicaria]KAI8085847.1 hypothetical protein B0P05DRAFT_533951 [Gilbertella persicaria]
MEEMVLELEEMTITKTKTYKKYGPEQIARFIHVLQEIGVTVPKAAEACGLPTSSAYKLLNQFNDVQTLLYMAYENTKYTIKK